MTHSTRSLNFPVIARSTRRQVEFEWPQVFVWCGFSAFLVHSLKLDTHTKQKYLRMKLKKRNVYLVVVAVGREHGRVRVVVVNVDDVMNGSKCVFENVSSSDPGGRNAAHDQHAPYRLPFVDETTKQI